MPHARPLIVVVDDNEYLLELVEARLRSEHWDVLLLRDGAAVQRTLGAKPANLLVLDIEMPGMNGLEVLARFKSNPRTANVPVIMLTGRKTSTDVQEARRLGATEYMIKPFNLEDLVRRIRGLLEPDENELFL